MDLNPPAGSKISIVTDGPDPTIVIPQPDSPMAHLAGVATLEVDPRPAVHIWPRATCPGSPRPKICCAFRSGRPVAYRAQRVDGKQKDDSTKS